MRGYGKRLTAVVLFVAFFVISLTACTTPTAEVVAPTMTPTPAAAPTPTPEPKPEEYGRYDYGRARPSEYVYLSELRGVVFHEIDCPWLFGDLQPILLVDALEQEIPYAKCCAELGKNHECNMPMNEGYARTIPAQRKVQMISEGGTLVQDIVYVTTGDTDFDINSNFMNYSCRFFYKEFGVDTADIKVHVRNNSKEYHNIQCEKIAGVSSSDRYYVYLFDAYEQGYTACKTCLPPIIEYSTMPVMAMDDARYFYSTPSYIQQVLRGGIPDPSMKIDTKSMFDGFYDE